MLEVTVSPAITCKPGRGRLGLGGAGLHRGSRGSSPGVLLSLRARPGSAQRKPMSAACSSAWASSSPSTSSHCSSPAGRAAGEFPGIAGLATLSPPDTPSCPQRGGGPWACCGPPTPAASMALLTAASLGRQQKRKGLLAAMDSPSLDTGEGLEAAASASGTQQGGVCLGAFWLLCPLEAVAKPLVLQEIPTVPLSPACPPVPKGTVPIGTNPDVGGTGTSWGSGAGRAALGLGCLTNSVSSFPRLSGDSQHLYWVGASLGSVLACELAPMPAQALLCAKRLGSPGPGVPWEADSG